MRSVFCAVNITEDIEILFQDFNFLKLNQNRRNRRKIKHIFGNVESTTKADHI